ncbi:hypothetical protein S83_071334 [Arachis hypogaea]
MVLGIGWTTTLLYRDGKEKVLLLSLGIGVWIVFYACKRVYQVACNYPHENITFKIDESSSNPNYLAFVIWYQQGIRDITAVLLCETENFECKLLDRSHGAVWTCTCGIDGIDGID